MRPQDLFWFWLNVFVVLFVGGLEQGNRGLVLDNRSEGTVSGSDGIISWDVFGFV